MVVAHILPWEAKDRYNLRFFVLDNNTIPLSRNEEKQWHFRGGGGVPVGETGRVISLRKRVQGRVWDFAKRPLYHTIKRQISLWRGFFFMDEIVVFLLGVLLLLFD